MEYFNLTSQILYVTQQTITFNALFIFATAQSDCTETEVVLE